MKPSARKTQICNFRVTREEMAQIKLAARKAGQAYGAWVREVVLREAVRTLSGRISGDGVGR